MSTITSTPTSSRAIKKAARAMRFAEIFQGLSWWSAIFAGGLLLLVVLDGVLRLPQAVRLSLSLVFGGFVLIAFFRKVWKPLTKSISPEHAARTLEMTRGMEGNPLINAYQFEKELGNESVAKYIAPTLESSHSLLATIKPSTLWLTTNIQKWLLLLLLLLGAWFGTVTLFPRSVSASMARFLMPLSDVPPAGEWKIDVKPSGQISLMEGDRLDIVVDIKAYRSIGKQAPVPTIVWKEGGGNLESQSGANKAAMLADASSSSRFKFSFSSVSRPFSFRVWADDSYSSEVNVRVNILPRFKDTTYEVEPPEYTGLKPYVQPGPPTSVNVPAGSTVSAAFSLSPTPQEVSWREKGNSQLAKKKGDAWRMTRLANESIAYDILAVPSSGSEARVLAHSQINTIADRPPEVDFVTDERNLIINPGSSLPITVKATDDYGIASIALKLARNDDPTAMKVIKSWSYMGPPGQKTPPAEKYKLILDPNIFAPGSVYLLTVEATDFSPAQQTSTSRPILIRVSGIQDLSVPKGDALEKFFTLLKGIVAKQAYANGLTDNLALHIPEALAAKDVQRHRAVMNDAQKQVRDMGKSAYDEATKHSEAQSFLVRLQSLVGGEMGLALEQIAKVTGKQEDELKKQLSPLQKRQEYILNELVALLGQISSERQEAAKKNGKKESVENPAIAANKLLAELKDELKNFKDDQKKIINASKTLKDLKPEDLTEKQDALLGELAREEAKKAAYFQEKLTDFSKLPLQDFADGKVVDEINQVFQEVQAAAAGLYEKKVELAIPREEAGLEKAEELEQNLERWLFNHADNIKWIMEEDSKQADIALSELPKELEDIVGDLLDKEEEMGEDVEDVSSTFMDNLDKGAGWGTDDGPISNMSARGVTGNRLPNNMEVGGRSGEGRSGKSSGQMVQSTAEGKGGRETPTRMSATPFEQGSVDDKAKDNKGGATGGGKQAGFGQEGLRGPMGPQAQQKLGRIAEQQTKLRQQAEAMVLQLRKQRKATGDLESAVVAMKKVEDAAKKQNGVEMVQGYHQVMDALSSARSSYRGNRVTRLEGNALNRQSKDTSDSQSEGVPSGYEDMASAYFRALSESNAKP